MTTLDQLFKRLNTVERENASRAAEIRAEIQAKLDARYDDWKALQTALEKLENYDGVEYLGNADGISAWIRFHDLADICPEERDYFETYVSKKRCAHVDWENDTLQTFLGDDHYQVQDDDDRNNGVWQGNKRLFDESEYQDESGDVDEEKRNALIEQHMNQKGYFPGVFRVTRHGDVYLVDTAPKGK